jgi:transcriptional regulator with XRE-family HTH domain
VNQRTPPIRPEVWEQPAMRTALAQRDIARVYKLLTAAGISQHGIARLTGQSQSEVSEVLSGRQVKQVDVLERICDGLGAPAAVAELGLHPAAAVWFVVKATEVAVHPAHARPAPGLIPLKSSPGRSPVPRRARCRAEPSVGG